MELDSAKRKETWRIRSIETNLDQLPDQQAQGSYEPFYLVGICADLKTKLANDLVCGLVRDGEKRAVEKLGEVYGEGRGTDTARS